MFHWRRTLGDSITAKADRASYKVTVSDMLTTEAMVDWLPKVSAQATSVAEESGQTAPKSPALIGGCEEETLSNDVAVYKYQTHSAGNTNFTVILRIRNNVEVIEDSDSVVAVDIDDLCAALQVTGGTARAELEGRGDSKSSQSHDSGQGIELHVQMREREAALSTERWLTGSRCGICTLNGLAFIRLSRRLLCDEAADKQLRKTSSLVLGFF
jgi:hypothetical protein